MRTIMLGLFLATIFSPAALGAPDVYVRFLGVKKTSSGVARQSVVLTEKG